MYVTWLCLLAVAQLGIGTVSINEGRYPKGIIIVEGNWHTGSCPRGYCSKGQLSPE